MNKITVLHVLANTMKRAGITNNVTIIARARVPIIKFVTSHGGLSVDINLNRVGVFAGGVVFGLLKELSALRALVLIIKAFMSQRSMNEVFSGGLGSHNIVCLAVSFCRCTRGEISPSENLGVLMTEFFELYGYYLNYHEVGILPRGGGSYFARARRGRQDPIRPHLLSIEDPNDVRALWIIVCLLMFYPRSERCVKRLLQDRESENHVRGSFQDLDVQCVLSRARERRVGTKIPSHNRSPSLLCRLFATQSTIPSPIPISPLPSDEKTMCSCPPQPNQGFMHVGLG